MVQKKRELTYKPRNESIICSLIILVNSKIDVAQRLKKMGINSINDFEWNKIIKSRYVRKTDDRDEDVKIEIFNAEKSYGCDYLGMYSRLVITNLTERMQVIYMLAQKYSLGGAAVGPAGTGKSETTKDISRVNGKTCIIYNCSEDFKPSTFMRLLKGLSITGLWMCFDEFNRFPISIFSVVSENLSYLLKFRRFKHRMEINFSGDLIWLNPEFQICITYNPTYLGRQTIPVVVN